MPQLFSGKILISVILLTVIDICLTPIFGAARPMTAYILIIFAVLEGIDGRKIAGLAILAGGLRDLAGIEPLGVETFVLFLGSLAFAFVVSKIDHESPLIRIGIVFLFVLSVCFVRLALSAFLTGSNAIPTEFLFLSIISSFSTAMISPVFFSVMKGWFGKRGFLKQYELFK